MKWSLWQAGITLEAAFFFFFNICLFENLDSIPFDIERLSLPVTIKL